jgi:hypothetical protein
LDTTKQLGVEFLFAGEARSAKVKTADASPLSPKTSRAAVPTKMSGFEVTDAADLRGTMPEVGRCGWNVHDSSAAIQACFRDFAQELTE